MRVLATVVRFAHTFQVVTQTKQSSGDCEVRGILRYLLVHIHV